MKKITAKKRFGQNFLQDQVVIADIIASFAPSHGEHCVEIGPGLGALTFPLLKKIKPLDVIEIDRDIIAKLQKQVDLIIHEADVLTVDFRALKNDERPLRLIGNLPYNISTPLLFHVFTQLDVIQDMHFMLQQEVVDRMAAAPGTKIYGRLSVMVQYYCAVTELLTIPPQAFKPAPKVFSKFVRLIPHAQKPVIAQDEDHFAALVRLAFSQRRKTIRNSLKEQVSEAELVALGISPQARAENLSVADFVAMANLKA